MKVLMINGSRREKGCTYTALHLIEQVLNQEGIETEILFVGKRAVNGEIDALVKEAIEKMKEADGLVLGSPVYYASATGEIIAFLDRFFWNGGTALRGKPASVLASARRGGTTAALEVLNKYPTYMEMPLISSRYWNMVHGNTPAEVMQDAEGVQIMETLGRNMAWILKCIEAGRQVGITQPPATDKVFTNFIR